MYIRCVRIYIQYGSIEFNTLTKLLGFFDQVDFVTKRFGSTVNFFGLFCLSIAEPIGIALVDNLLVLLVRVRLYTNHSNTWKTY